MSGLKIERIETFLLQPVGPEARLVVVRVQTSEPGLYGLGCATFTQRIEAVRAALDHHLGPFVVGKDPGAIRDLFQSMMVSAYWRNGPVLNNAISGIDMALWDIKGKRAGMPCYELWGGPCRAVIPAYTHAGGATIEATIESALKKKEAGWKAIRCQLGGYTGEENHPPVPDAPPGRYQNPRDRLSRIPELFRRLRETLGDDVELLYDVHERMAPIDAIQLAKYLEPYHLFFLEDAVAPEDGDYLEMLRAQCATPIALGELFNNPREIVPLVSRRLIDFLRVHPSQMGGITPCLDLAALCAAFGVRVAWHGPHDVSPIGAAANIQMDMAVANLGIQEWAIRNEAERAIFPGLPEARDGVIVPNGRPGLGIDFDEKLAAEFPCDPQDLDWTLTRLPDGGMSRP